ETAIGPVVKVFSGTTGGLIANFNVPGLAFKAGISIAAADLNGDGKAEIIVGAGGADLVRVYNPLTGSQVSGPLGESHAFGCNGHGVFVNADGVSGDVNGDGVKDIVVSTAAGVTDEVKVFSSADLSVLRDITPFGTATGGVRASLAYVDDDSRADIV